MTTPDQPTDQPTDSGDGWVELTFEFEDALYDWMVARCDTEGITMDEIIHEALTALATDQQRRRGGVL